MATTREDIRGWFERGVKMGATHMIVVCDTFDWDDYPVYVAPNENARDKYKEFNGKDMQKVMEVYNLKEPMAPQVDTNISVFNF